MQAQHENGIGEESSGLINVPAKKRAFPMSAEERRMRRKEINRESARRIRKRKNNEMEGLKQQVLHPFVYQLLFPLITCYRSGVLQYAFNGIPPALPCPVLSYTMSTVLHPAALTDKFGITKGGACSSMV